MYKSFCTIDNSAVLKTIFSEKYILFYNLNIVRLILFDILLCSMVYYVIVNAVF